MPVEEVAQLRLSLLHIAERLCNGDAVKVIPLAKEMEGYVLPVSETTEQPA